MSGQKKKFLFLYLRTGGGHIAPARSIANYLSKYKSDQVETILIDGLEKSNWLSKAIVEDGYRVLQGKTKWVFAFIYFLHKFKPIAYFSEWLLYINMIKYLTQSIHNEKPDKIVIVHFFLIKPVYQIIKKYNLKIPVVTIVTDPYTPHPLWFLRKNQNFVVFSEELKQRCILKGISAGNINVFPFILDEKFSVPPAKEEIDNFRNKLGFATGRLLLIMGGGDGIPNGIAILNGILKSKPDYQIAFVCGRNKVMYDQAIQIKQKSGIENLTIYGFIDFVYELLCISDVVITKCGASTFMEILLSKKIPLVNSYIWEQEKGNVDYLVKNELGIFEKRISKLPHIINKLFTNEVTLNKYKSNIENANLKNGTADVAEFILSIK